MAMTIMQKYFVRYLTGRYDAWDHKEFLDVAEVERFLSGYATNPDFTFEVVYGQRLEFEPTEIVQAYRVKHR